MTTSATTNTRIATPMTRFTTDTTKLMDAASTSAVPWRPAGGSAARMYPATALTEETDCVPSARHSAARVLRAEAVYLELPVLICLAPPVAGFASIVVRQGQAKRDGRRSLAVTGRHRIPRGTAEFDRRKKLRNEIFNGSDESDAETTPSVPKYLSF